MLSFTFFIVIWIVNDFQVDCEDLVRVFKSADDLNVRVLAEGKYFPMPERLIDQRLQVHDAVEACVAEAFNLFIVERLCEARFQQCLIRLELACHFIFILLVLLVR